MVSTYNPPLSKGGSADLLSLWKERNTRTKLQRLPFDMFLKKREVIQTSLSRWRY